MGVTMMTGTLGVRLGSRTVDELLLHTDALLEAVLQELAEMVARTATEGERAGRVRRGPAHIDLVGELTERTLEHGKRFRPVLAHWGWVAGDGDHRTYEHIVRVAAALELLQLFALIQDDVMDRSHSRRGRTCLHVSAAGQHRAADGLGDPVLFGDGVATLVSDLALSEASLLIAPTTSEVRAAWRVMTVEMVEGQLLDLTHTASRGRDLKTAMRIARSKSGRYTISRPLQLGALVAGAEPSLVRGLGGWGDLVGDAFALRDDVLGVWGDPARTGKPAGDDLRSGKPTALLAWASELLPEADRPLLVAFDAGTLDDRDVTALQGAMIHAGVLERAEQAISDLVANAERALARLDIDTQTRDALREIASAVAWRNS